MPVKRLCKTCGRSIIAFSTLENKCYDCKRKAAKPTERKPIKKQGKRTKAWLAYRKEYLKLHPPSHEGYYTCYLCRKAIPANEITLDHILPRSSNRELTFNEDNLAFCCYTCNIEKGSKKY